MSLHFVLGPAGSGKTTRLYNIVLQEAKAHPETTYYYLVPEQFSLKTQRDLVGMSPQGGILNIDATSMARLANEAFLKLSGIEHDFLPEIGKSMIIKKVLLEKKKELVMYGRSCKKPGFVAEVKALLSEFMQYHVTTDDLEEAIASSVKEPVLCRKLGDMLTIMKAFYGFLDDGYLTNEGMYDAFADILRESGLLKNAVIVLDGFTGFTPSQNALLSGFLRLAKDVYAAFTIDKESFGRKLSEWDRFYMSRVSVEKLSRLADECGCVIEDPIFTDYDKYGNKALSHLERNLFVHGASSVPSEGAVNVFSAASVREEAKIVSAEIERLIRVSGLRYRDIGIIVSDPDTYTPVLTEELSKINALVFTDRKRALVENQCVGLVRIILRLMEKGPDTELLLAYAKNSLSGISHEDACILENYCIGMGIRGSAFKKPFEKEFYGRSDIELGKVEEIRKELMNELSEVFGVKTGSVRRFAERLFTGMRSIGLEEKLENLSEAFLENGDLLRAKEYGKVFPAIIDILDNLVMFLGNEIMGATEFREIIEAGLSEGKVGLVPAGSEQIVIGDMERTRFGDLKVLFLLGANEGKLPKTGSGRAILTERDKEKLADKGMELSAGGLKKTGNDRFYEYLALTRPTEKLYVSFAARDDSGNLKISPTVSEIAKLFTDVRVLSKKDLDPVLQALENDGGLTMRLATEREKRAAERKAYAPEAISPEMAQKIYGEKIYGSISRLETYASCAFRHFLSYGLKLNERDEYRLTNADFGNVAHEALELYGEKLKSEDREWTSVSEEERSSLIRECAKEATDHVRAGIFSDSGKNAYIAERVAGALELTVDMLTRQIAESDFRPWMFEKKFTVDESEFVLSGKIDRIDICDKNGIDAVKVVDYKSGKHDLDLVRLYHGLSLQLPVYMKEALSEADRSGNGHFIPAALLYDMIRDPLVDVEGDAPLGTDDPDATLKLEKEFTSTGIVNSSIPVIKALDHSFDDMAGGLRAKVKSTKIPVSTNKEGELAAVSSVMAESDIEILSEWAVTKMKDQTKKIMAGDAEIAPVMVGKRMEACEYCPYASVCGHDLKNGGRVKRIAKDDTDDILTKMRNRVKENG